MDTYSNKHGIKTAAPFQPLWHRIVLLTVLAYEGLGCLTGGGLLIARPDGSIMKMPVEIIHGAFPDFLIPGVILFALGVLTMIAFFSVLRRSRLSWLPAGLSLGGLTIWFWVEIAILQELHWLHAMWGLPVLAGDLAVLSLFTSRALRNALLSCGILASLLYAGVNILVPPQWPEYDPMSRTVSELSAVGAPTRALWIVLTAPYTLLTILFGVGVWKFAGTNRNLLYTGFLLVAYGSLGILWPFAPMHARHLLASGRGTITDTMHLVLGGVTQVLYLAALVITAIAMKAGFRLYSFITVVLLAIFAVFTFIEAPAMALNLPTPYIGLWERINIGLFMLWQIVLAAILLWERSRRAAETGAEPPSDHGHRPQAA